jgi:hypothetical protein
MKVKKKYKIGDKVWVYGVSSGAGFNRPTAGTVVHEMEIDGFYGVHYVIAIATEIETLLEIRNWETISQDSKGPVGSFREAISKYSPARKVLARTGLILPMDDLYDDEEPVEDNNNESDNSQ